MSTKSHKRKNNQQEGIEKVIDSLVSPISVQSVGIGNQGVKKEGASSAKSPSVGNSDLENLRLSLKEKFISEIEALLIESQKKLLKL